MKISKTELQALLVEACGSKEVLQHPSALIDSGLLDSLAIITLFEELSLLGIHLQPTELTTADLNSIDRLYQCLEAAASFSGEGP